MRGQIANHYAVDYSSNAATFFDGIKELPDDQLTEFILHSGIRQWMVTDPEETRRRIAELPMEMRTVAASKALEARSAFDSAGDAVDFARESGVADLPWNVAVWAGALEDAHVMAEFLEELPDEVVTRQGGAFASTWAANDPSEAVTWAGSLGDRGVDLMDDLATGWGQVDVYAASGWVATLESGPARDNAVTGLTSALLNYDPSAAFTWALTIADENKRGKAVRLAFSRWSENSKQEAIDAATQADLPEPLRKELLSRP